MTEFSFDGASLQFIFPWLFAFYQFFYPSEKFQLPSIKWFLWVTEHDKLKLEFSISILDILFVLLIEQVPGELWWFKERYWEVLSLFEKYSELKEIVKELFCELDSFLKAKRFWLGLVTKVGLRELKMSIV